MGDIKLIAANGGKITVTGTATATLKLPDHREQEVTIYLSPDVKRDRVIISCEVMVKMGILKIPTPQMGHLGQENAEISNIKEDGQKLGNINKRKKVI